MKFREYVFGLSLFLLAPVFVYGMYVGELTGRTGLLVAFLYLVISTVLPKD